MFETSLNQRTVTVKISRIELCDLLLACTSAQYQANDGGEKWKRLHDKLKSQLDDFDKKIEEKEVNNVIK